MKSLKLLSFILATLLAASSYSTAQSLQKGQIEAFLVDGDVSLLNTHTGEYSKLTPGTVFGSGFAIQTGVASSALLVFSNGSSVNLQPGSHLDINKFLQAPFEHEGSYLTLQQDPSKSITEMFLSYGELIGEVKKLTAESNYSIKTPAGQADIIGTTFMVRFTPDSDGGRTEILNLNGTVIANLDGNVLNLNPGQIVTVQGSLVGTEWTIDSNTIKDATPEQLAQANIPASQIQDARSGGGVPAGIGGGNNNQGPGQTETPATDTRVVTVSPI